MLLKSSPAKVRLQRLAQLGYSYSTPVGCVGGGTNYCTTPDPGFILQKTNLGLHLYQSDIWYQPATYISLQRGRLKEKLLKCFSGACFTAVPFKSYIWSIINFEDIVIYFVYIKQKCESNSINKPLSTKVSFLKSYF